MAAKGKGKTIHYKKVYDLFQIKLAKQGVPWYSE
jgi:hypothetical protein